MTQEQTIDFYKQTLNTYMSVYEDIENNKINYVQLMIETHTDCGFCKFIRKTRYNTCLNKFILSTVLDKYMSMNKYHLYITQTPAMIFGMVSQKSLILLSFKHRITALTEIIGLLSCYIINVDEF